jgi:hypothetical protein
MYKKYRIRARMLSCGSLQGSSMRGLALAHSEVARIIGSGSRRGGGGFKFIKCF